jgi:hypothetical protein
MIATLMKEYERFLDGNHLEDLLGDPPLAVDRTAS